MDTVEVLACAILRPVSCLSTLEDLVIAPELKVEMTMIKTDRPLLDLMKTEEGVMRRDKLAADIYFTVSP